MGREEEKKAFLATPPSPPPPLPLSAHSLPKAFM